MKLLIDTNVILDVLLDRKPFSDTAVKVLALSEQNKFYGFVSASAITDIYYIANRALKDKQAVRLLIQNLLNVVSIAGVADKEIRKALELEWGDFEDSVQYSVAVMNQMEGIITRNPKDYKDSQVRILLPEEILEIIE